ncbi:hypothetical protein DB88DRAFT_519264 [Papiliotrema laurentii]|uniref:Uncharacterized protein n=1 Tax=Papiliotrema laurentii TaxID=5418 RepID=A0AAD9CUS8_PAPLA|nr:hypothetical protein DB88DRAFT_519264 [Papiliotrema laurentii]
MTFQTEGKARSDPRCHTSATPAQQWPMPSSRTGLQTVPRDDLPEVVPVFQPAHTALNGENDVLSFFTDDCPQTTTGEISTPTGKWRSLISKFTGRRTLFGSLISSLTPRSDINPMGNNANHLSTSGSAMIPPSVYMYNSTLSPCTQDDPLTSTAPTAVQLSSGNPPTNVGVFVPAESEPGTNPSPLHEPNAWPIACPYRVPEHRPTSLRDTVFELPTSYKIATAERSDLHTRPNAQPDGSCGSEPGGPSRPRASTCAVSPIQSAIAVKTSSLTTLSRHMIQLQLRSTIRLPDLLQALVAESPRMECKQGRERSRQPTCPRHQRAPPTVGPPRARLIWMSDHRVQNLRVGPQAPAPCALSSRDPDHIYPFRGKISPQRPLEDHPRISSFSIPSIPSWFGRCCRSVMQMMRAPPSAQGLQVIKDPLDGQKCAV